MYEDMLCLLVHVVASIAHNTSVHTECLRTQVALSWTLLVTSVPTCNTCSQRKAYQNAVAASLFQALVGTNFAWSSTTGSRIPTDALAAGQTATNEHLYVGRVLHDGTLTLGKVRLSHEPSCLKFLNLKINFCTIGFHQLVYIVDRFCGLLVRFLGYRSGSPGSIPGTTRNKSNGSGTGSTQPREYNWGATW
jgi:hypothetical protein